MPAPTNSELIHILREKTAELDQLALLQDQQLKQYAKKLDDHTKLQGQDHDRIAELITQVAVASEQLRTIEAQLLLKLEQARTVSLEKQAALEERIKSLEASSTRAWQVWLALLGAALALLVAFVKR